MPLHASEIIDAVESGDGDIGGGWDALIDVLDNIVTALNYIHKKKFVHRDLKPRNGIKPNYKRRLMQSQFFFPDETRVGN